MSSSNTNSKPSDNQTTNGDNNPPTTYPLHISSTSGSLPQDPTILAFSTTSNDPSISETESEPKELSVGDLMNLKVKRIAALER